MFWKYLKKPRLKALWSGYRHVAAVKGLLEWMGLWNFVAFPVVATLSWIVARLSAFPPWAWFLLFLAGIVLTLEVMLRVRAWRDKRISEAASSIGPPTPKPAPAPEPTLPLLMNSDFPSLHKFHGKPLFNRADGTACQVEDVLYTDFRAGSKFLGVYVPSSPDAAQIILFLAGRITELGDALSNDLQVTARMPGEKPRNVAILSYTGQVYVYHQDYLTARSIADIEDAFTAQGLNVVLRGPDFLASAWLDWKRKTPP
jgi:hypothetical protein